jgi:hypothetical protein
VTKPITLDAIKEALDLVVQKRAIGSAVEL